MTNNMNGSQKFLQVYKVKWHGLEAAYLENRQITLEDLPSYQEVKDVFNECMRTRELPGSHFNLSTSGRQRGVGIGRS
jgi:hypothetical protein